MKKRISATVDDETIGIIKLLLKQGKFRNKSHVIEEAIKLLKEENET
ncbi:MAG: ribbon-helix-helix protein, CopG family [archaeon]